MLRVIVVLAVIAARASAAPPSLKCSSCHQPQAKFQPHTGMAQALQSAAVSPILQTHPKLTFRQGPYAYTIERDGDRSSYTVTDGKDQIRVPIAWSFGLGAAGQTYLLLRNNSWYESRVSYYRDTDALDLTTGARPDVPASLEDAFGRELSPKGAQECFDCHSTGALVNGKLQTESLIAGVQCARCHERADEHMVSVQQAASKPKVMPRKLGSATTEEMSEFCGQCHRTWSQIATNGPHNVTNVRFQPYRLTNSKCYDVTDARIRCTSCHDVHTEVQRTASSYDARCQACHSAGGKQGAKICTIGQKDCVTCHMPKVNIPETHNNFTDHWIRIARTGDPYPN